MADPIQPALTRERLAELRRIAEGVVDAGCWDAIDRTHEAFSAAFDPPAALALLSAAEREAQKDEEIASLHVDLQDVRDERDAAEAELAQKDKALAEMRAALEPSATEISVLGYLIEHAPSGECCRSFASIATAIGLSRNDVANACHGLRHRKLVEYYNALFTEEGEVAGSGYCASDKGHIAYALLAQHKGGER